MLAHGDTSTWKSLIDTVRWRAVHEGDKRVFTFLPERDGEPQHVTFDDLDTRARAIAAKLQQQRLAGERALLLYPTGLDYVAAFLGCLYAGVTAVPAYPPDPRRLARTLPRLKAIFADANACVALTTSSFASMARVLGIGAAHPKTATDAPSEAHSRTASQPSTNPGAPRFLATDAIDSALKDDWQPPAITADSLAFLQYTSGSTSSPKGVMVSHGNLTHNSAMIKQSFRLDADSRGIIWLPLYHDMGLIGGVLQPIMHGFHCTIMSPLSFLRSPLGWLKLVSNSGDHSIITGGPNFAYELCARKVGPADLSELDLGNWSVAFCGAEPINGATLERFSSTFRSCGFKSNAFLPCYGLAEATLIVSGTSPKAKPTTISVKRSALEAGRIDEPEVTAECIDFVGCGRSLLDETVIVVDPETRTLQEADRVGEIWVASKSVAQGYWNRPEETSEYFRAFLADSGDGPYLRTGDLGFLRDGELFITGRLKDLIIIRGTNHYPQDIEATVQRSHESLRLGQGAAFSINVDSDERLVIVQEARASSDLDSAVRAIREAIAEKHDLQTHAIALIMPRTLPKTSSGKIQRHACREAFLKGELQNLAAWRGDDARSDLAEPRQPDMTRAIATESDLEAWLVAQLAQTLRCDPSKIDVARSFASLGLDSLQAVELAAQLENRLHLPVAPTVVWDHPSIRATARHLAKATRDAGTPTHTLPETRDNDTPAGDFPLSHGQQALWFQHKVTPTSIYNIVYAVTIRSELDVTHLQHALQRVVDRHASLRTTFTARSGQPRQRVHAHMPVAFVHHDAATWTHSALASFVDDEAQRPFDLETGPLLRVTVCSRAPDEHVMLIGVHHIVSDLWSLALIARELAASYGASETTAVRPQLSRTYADFVAWQNRELGGKRGRELAAFWRTKLAGMLPVLEIPTDRPRPQVSTYAGAFATTRLDAKLTQYLHATAKQHDATLYVLLLAAFKVLLHRYTGLTDLIVGTPALGRTQSDFADVVGYFVNPVALRSTLSPHGSFATFLATVGEAVREALVHQDYPFSLALQDVQANRDPGRTPVFQVMFVLQKTHVTQAQGLGVLAVGQSGTHVRLGGLDLESFPLERAVAPFDMTVLLAEGHDGLNVSVLYNRDLYEKETVERLLANYQSLLTTITANPRERISTLKAISSKERQTLLQEWRDRSTRLPDECILEQLDAPVARLPDAVAVDFDGAQLTYGELNRRANQLGRHLRSLGVGPEHVVGICLDRSLEMAVAVVGVLKSGAAFLPLDPTYPESRLDYMLRDAGARAFIAAGPIAERLATERRACIRVDVDQPQIDEQLEGDLTTTVASQNLAYVIYTSGSTGRPKGVELQHRGLCNFIRGYRRRMGIEHGDRYLQFASFSFDAAVAEMFIAFSAGATLCLVARDTTMSNTALLESLRRNAITAAIMPPSRLSVLNADDLPALRVLMTAGEACTPAIVERWSRGRKLFNGYGPTEATIGPTIHGFAAARPATPQIPIGRPIPHMHVYILDENQQLLPIGAHGEICIAGVGLARAYRNRPELTAQKFLPDPFTTERGSRLYRTGDLGRFRADGTLEFLGRLDDQVKIRGYRIELGEIEAALERHSEVAAAAVLTVGEGAERRLVGYVVPRQQASDSSDGPGADDATFSSSSIRAYLQQDLPEHMIPSAIVSVPEFPLTANGKIDRTALAKRKATLDSVRVAPRNELETQLAGIWQRLLDVEAVSVHDNFFELGGHSLKMAQAQDELKTLLGRELPITDLFRYPTIATLARYLTVAEHDSLPLQSTQDRALLQKRAVQQRAEAGRKSSPPAAK